MSVSDNFNRADGGLGANWTDQAGTNGIVSNQAVPVSSGDGFFSSFYSGVSFVDDQSSQLLRGNSNNYCFVCVRMSGLAGSRNGYLYYNHGSIRSMVAGVETEIGTDASYASGDTAKLVASGTTITPYVNGVAGTPITDSSIASGSPGFGFYSFTGQAIDDWVGTGEITTAKRFVLIP